jgi:hypothetical protein
MKGQFQLPWGRGNPHREREKKPDIPPAVIRLSRYPTRGREKRKEHPFPANERGKGEGKKERAPLFLQTREEREKERRRGRGGLISLGGLQLRVGDFGGCGAVLSVRKEKPVRR